MPRPQIILSGQDTPDTLSAFEQDVIDQCRARGLDCLLVPNLYHVPESSKLWKSLSDRWKNAILLAWLHPRPMQWLLQRHQVTDQPLTILNLAAFSDAASVLRTVAAVAKAAPQTKPRPGNLEQLGTAADARWYPVLDHSRCVNCQHCLQFCLFGVYELDVKGKVIVRHPDHCKPGCPACSRICPQSAIMFPLYEKDAAIAGSPGEFVQLDAAARKMFYIRTGRPCPNCGQVADTKSRKSKTATTVLCPECGRPQSAKTSTPTSEPKPDRPPFDDLDNLVDQLDKKMQRRR
jgi:Pyruvate/2-oxoacid:ferredoxin oxidoreductase delta subunit